MNLFGILGAAAQIQNAKARADAKECQARLREQQAAFFAEKSAVAAEARKGKIIETKWKRT